MERTPPAKRCRAVEAPDAGGDLLTPEALAQASSRGSPFCQMLERAPPTFAGDLAELLWNVEEYRRHDEETGLITTRRRLAPDLPSLLCASKGMSLSVVTGVKEIRGNGRKRNYAEVMMLFKMISFLQQFRSTWTSSRKLRVRRSSEADRQEAQLIIELHLHG